MISIVVAVGLCALVGQAFALSVFVVNMITAMGLALGIDYALFVLSRYREERGRGLDEDRRDRRRRARPRAARCSSAASPFVLAMFGMLLVP